MAVQIVIIPALARSSLIEGVNKARNYGDVWTLSNQVHDPLYYFHLVSRLVVDGCLLLRFSKKNLMSLENTSIRQLAPKSVEAHLDLVELVFFLLEVASIISIQLETVFLQDRRS